MSYIGKNPEADSVKLKGSATEPSGTAVDGQVYFNTGAGSISKGMKVYKNSQFVAIDKQLGDAETMQLLKAADIPAIDFSLSVTSTTVGGQGAVPFESSTGDFDGTAAFTNSSTGDALLTDDSADLVFHYTTQATNSADNDFWGIPLTVPRAFRGGNLVLEFKYRTEIATGTMDDGYFNIAIQDRSAMILQTQASTISAGAIAAGANVLLTAKTYTNPVTSTSLTVAVGDRVFVESGTGTAGSQTNDIVDCYITSVSSTDNNVTLSKDIVAVQSGKFVTGWLTGYDTGGQIDAFASDTNKDGTTKKLAFKTDADTQQVSLWFFVKGTSTVKHELFFDNVLLSGNKFLQASSQTKSEAYYVYSQADVWDATGTGPFYEWDVSLIDPGPDTPPLADSKLLSMGDITGPGTIGTVTAITAKQDITIYVTFTSYANNGGEFFIENSSAQHLAASYAPNSAAAGYENVAASINLAKDDYIYFKTYKTGARDGMISVTATPQTSPVILLESQDEIFTNWVDYTPTFEGFGSPANVKAQWRRVGQNIEVVGSLTTGTVSTDYATISLPSGLSIDTGVSALLDAPSLGTWQSNQTQLNPRWIYCRSGYTEKVYITEQSVARAPTTILNGDIVSGSTTINDFNFTVPIAGWNANFNPLLSMPLVDIGSDLEQYSLNGWTGNAGTLSLYSTNAPNINTINKLGTISTMSSTVAWSFTASQRVKVNISAQYGQSTGGNWFSIASGPSTTAGDQDLAFDNAACLPVNKSMSISSAAGFGLSQSASFIMDPGEVCMIHLNGSGNVATGAHQGGVWMTAERDRSNTNMAHIIKPAYCRIYERKAWNSDGGGATAYGSWTDRDLLYMDGETWFVDSLASNIFTLQAGTYKIDAYAPFYQCDSSMIRLYDNTNSKQMIMGPQIYNGSTGASSGYANLSGSFTITTATAFKIQYAVQTTKSATGLGLSNFNSDFSFAHYTMVNIEKLK